MNQIAPERLSEWHLIWRSAGPARVAEELASSAMGKLVDELGVDKRKAAVEWLIQYHAESDGERRWTNRRSWIAIVLAGASIALTLVSLFIKARI
jgi:hypothetical protein